MTSDDHTDETPDVVARARAVDALPRDWARSYRRRQGKVTRAQKRALRELWPQYGLDCPFGVVLDMDAAFGRPAHTLLEVGFGMGEHLIAHAEAHPEKHLVGVEVHVPGLGAALQEVEARGLHNVRVIRHDVFVLLGRHLPADSLDEVCLFFPEPWPSDLSGRRRIVRPLLLDLLARCMRPGALLHLATDVAEYADHMLRVLDAQPGWTNDAGDGFAPRPSWRPLTKYEQKGIEEGRVITDLRFRLDG